MKKIVSFVAFLSMTQVSAYAAQVTVGVVNMQQVILTVEEGKQARNALQEEIREKEEKLKSMKTELDKINKEWQSQAALLSEEARMRKQSEFQEKFMALRNEEMQFQAEIKQKEAKATQGIAMQVSGMVNDLAKKKKLDLVFESNSSGLMYAKNPVDLTDEVIKMYDATPKAQSKSGAPKKGTSISKK